MIKSLIFWRLGYYDEKTAMLESEFSGKNFEFMKYM